MSALQRFMPTYGSGQALAPAAASAAVPINAQNKQVRVVNTGAAIAFVRTYSSLTVPEPAATAADLPIPAGASVTFSKDETHDRLAHISATGTTLQVITGEGF